MYSQDKTDIALQVYHQCGSVTNTIRMLGYPTRRALYTWIENDGVQKPPRKAKPVFAAAGAETFFGRGYFDRRGLKPH